MLLSRIGICRPGWLAARSLEAINAGQLPTLGLPAHAAGRRDVSTLMDRVQELES